MEERGIYTNSAPITGNHMEIKMPVQNFRLRQWNMFGSYQNEEMEKGKIVRITEQVLLVV